MIEFTRTPEGLSAIPIFEPRYDAYVIVEGSPGSPDILFWKKVFTAFRPNKNFMFQRGGGKQDILSIYQNNNFQKFKIVLCLDNDFDHLKSNSVYHNRIIRTKGYSLENDILSCVIDFDAILEILTKEIITTENAEFILNDILDDIDKKVLHVCASLMLAIYNGMTVSGEQVHSCLCYKNSKTFLDIPLLFSVISNWLDTLDDEIKVPKAFSPSAIKDFRGHTLFSIFCSELKSRLNDMSYLVNIDQALLKSLLIKQMDLSAEPLFSHYSGTIRTALI